MLHEIVMQKNIIYLSRTLYTQLCVYIYILDNNKRGNARNIVIYFHVVRPGIPVYNCVFVYLFDENVSCIFRDRLTGACDRRIPFDFDSRRT